MMCTVPPGKIKSHPIDPHIKFATDLPGTVGLPFLDTWTNHTANSIKSTVYRKPTHTDRHLQYISNHPISTKLFVIHTVALQLLLVTHRTEKVCSTP